MRKKTIFWLMLPSYWILTALAIISISLYVFQSMSKLYESTLETDIETRAMLISKFIPLQLPQSEYDQLDDLCKKYGESTQTRYTIILPDGTVIADTDAEPNKMENHNNRSEVQAALNGQIGKTRRLSQTVANEMLYVAIPLLDESKALICAVRASVPLTAINEELRPMTTRVIFATLLTGLISMIVCVAVVRRITQPLQSMSRAAHTFAEGNFSHKIPKQDTVELAQLSHALNRMSGQLSDTLTTISNQTKDLNTVLKNMDEGVLAITQDRTLLHVNRVAGDILDTQHREIKKSHIEEYIHHKRLLHSINKLLEHQKQFKSEFDLNKKIIQINGKILKNAENDPIGALLVMRDVTHLRHLETVKSEFVANVSHELKTPITSIQGFVETLLSDDWDHSEEVRRFLNIIDQQSGRLNTILDDLLALSRLEQSEITRTAKTVFKIIEHAIQLVEPDAKMKEIEIKADCDHDLIWSVNAPLIEQVLVNLLTNSIKYSDTRRTVYISAHTSHDQLILIVKDEGFGIESKHINRLFERFYRVDSGRSSKLGGTGLGLAIVKHIIEVHQGEINVESAIGEGSIFTIKLPTLEIEAMP
ncbi:MAG: ATP-binding protein [Pontiellaceae bacterium]